MREVQSEKYDQDLEYNRKEFLKQLEKIGENKEKLKKENVK